jgi:hypothetical protein
MNGMRSCKVYFHNGRFLLAVSKEYHLKTKILGEGRLYAFPYF